VTVAKSTLHRKGTKIICKAATVSGNA
jgi:hypothetical protein